MHGVRVQLNLYNKDILEDICVRFGHFGLETLDYFGEGVFRHFLAVAVACTIKIFHALLTQ